MFLLFPLISMLCKFIVQYYLINIIQDDHFQPLACIFTGINIFSLIQPSPFFTEQLTAFEVWLDHGSEHKKPPEQLPIVLQVRCFF